MTRLLDLSGLPKSLAKRSDVRCFAMTVTRHPTRNEFVVQEPGHTAHVVVQYDSGSLSCDCAAAGHGNKRCAHVIAVQNTAGGYMPVDTALATPKSQQERVATNNAVYVDSGNAPITIVDAYYVYAKYVQDKRYPDDPKRRELKWCKREEATLQQLYLAVQIDDTDVVLKHEMAIKIGETAKYSKFLATAKGIHDEDAQRRFEPLDLIGFKGIANIECKQGEYTTSNEYHNAGETYYWSKIKDIFPREVRRPSTQPPRPVTQRPGGPNGAGTIPANQMGAARTTPVRQPVSQTSSGGFVDARATTKVRRPAPDGFEYNAQGHLVPIEYEEVYNTKNDPQQGSYDPTGDEIPF